MPKKSRINDKPAKRKKKKLRELKWLIYCNGETEKRYIKGLIDYLKIDKKVLFIKVESTGYNTLSLIKKTNEYYGTVYPHNTEYDRIFCVYDRDSFVQFGESVTLGEGYGYDIIWSNECFELWFILHFEYNDAALPRTSYFKELTDRFRKKNIISKDENYKEHAATRRDIFDIITHKTGGSFDVAVKRAEKLYGTYGKNVSPTERHPATKMHILINELKKYSEEYDTGV